MTKKPHHYDKGVKREPGIMGGLRDLKNKHRRLLLQFIVVVFLIGCGTGGFGAATDLEPDPALRVSEAVDRGVVYSPPRVQGRDGGYSAWFDGRSVWVFGDTLFTEKTSPHDGFHSNSWSWTSDFDASDGIGPFEQALGSDGRPSPLLPFTDEEKAFNAAHGGADCLQAPCGVRWALWPGALVADPVRRRLLLFYEKVYVAPGELNYTLYGSSVTGWENPASPPERLRFNLFRDHPTLMFHGGEPGFGDAAVVIDSWLYVYACDLQGARVPCRVARVDLEHVFEKTYWETFTADGRWRQNLNEGHPVFDGNEILSVSYNSDLGLFLAIYSQPMSTAVMLRTALNPEGPWSKPLEVFEAAAPVNRIGWVYDALEHPEFRQDSGRVLFITYSRQTSATTFEFRLVALRIERVD